MSEALPFFLLGLLVTVGYALWRAASRGRKRTAERGLEAFLTDAAREARQHAAQERGTLQLDPERELLHAKLRKRLEENDTADSQTRDNQSQSHSAPREE